MSAKPCEDHLGNKFESFKAMCKHYKTTPSTVLPRLKKGFSLKDALTQPTKYNFYTKDHLGNIFKSEREMAQYWNISHVVYSSRKRLNWDIEKILTTPVNNTNGNECKDHLGNTFPSIESMCIHYNIPRHVYEARIRSKKQYTLKEILTNPKHTNEITDHLGNIFKNIEEMCKYHNITKRLYEKRIYDFKWSLKKTLTTPKHATQCKSCKDHLGNVFKSVKEMCNYHNIPRNLYSRRIYDNWTLEEALTIPKDLYIGEYRVAECLKSMNIKFYHNVTIKTIFEGLNINIDWSEFLTQLKSNLTTAGYKWSEKKILKLRPDFTLYTDDDNKILGVIEFDGEQHQNFVEYFFKTIENFFKRNNADFAKQSLWEYMNLPMLRIRHDQIDNIEYMVKDFINNPENYIHNHNTYLSEKEYWSILTEQKEKLNLAFA